jgi:hypothetical protein
MNETHLFSGKESNDDHMYEEIMKFRRRERFGLANCLLTE